MNKQKRKMNYLRIKLKELDMKGISQILQIGKLVAFFFPIYISYFNKKKL